MNGSPGALAGVLRHHMSGGRHWVSDTSATGLSQVAKGGETVGSVLNTEAGKGGGTPGDSLGFHAKVSTRPRPAFPAMRAETCLAQMPKGRVVQAY